MEPSLSQPFFKETDRNGFICTNSCRHPAWLRSVPVSQFLRLRRNCTRSEDCVREASALKSHFLEKGYNEAEFEQAIDRATKKNREELLVPREARPNDGYKHAFFTTFSTQQYAIKNILRKHWNVFRNDGVLGPFFFRWHLQSFSGVLHPLDFKWLRTL